MPEDRGSDTSHEKPAAAGATPRAPADTVVQQGFPLLARDPATPAPPGYELLAEVGRGGMGVVYRARDLALGRDVAIKILQDRYASDGPVARQFLEEAQITGQLVHPGVPPIHLVGSLPDGRPFLVMKLIKGHTLDLLLTEKTERDRLIAIFENLCGTVGYAHERSVIHRDLKPSNVMVGAFGEVQVMDWGLAKVLRNGDEVQQEDNPQKNDDAVSSDYSILRVPHSDETVAGSVMGTVSYMSPEQAAGELAKVDRRTDVFALGGILCTILTGRPPYTGADASEIHLKAVRGQTADAFASLSDCGADPELVTLAKRCLANDPAERPKDAGEVAKAVADYRRAIEEHARRTELERVRAEAERDAIRRSQQQIEATPAQSPPNITRRMALLGVPAVAAISLGAYFAFRKRDEGLATDGGGVSPLTPPPPVPPAILVPCREVAGDVAGVAVSDDGRWLAVALESEPPGTTGGVKLFDRSQGDKPPVWWKWQDTPCRGVAFSPDGTLLAIAAVDSLRVLNLSDGNEIAFPDATIQGAARAVAFSPNGKVVALACEQADAADRTPRPGLARVWDVASRAKPRDFSRLNMPVKSVAFSSDSTLIATGLGARSNNLASSVEVWKVASGHERSLDAALAVTGPFVVFARSAHLCAASEREWVKLYQLPSFEVERDFSSNGLGEPTAIALRPDGTLLAMAVAGAIHTYDTSTGIGSVVKEKHEKGISTLAFTFDGKTLISGGHDRTVREWTVSTPTPK